jgi:hypothetical protein
MMHLLPFPLTPHARRRVFVRMTVVGTLIALAAAARWASEETTRTSYLSRTQNVTSSQ